jgi:signal transduction histidine kinase
MRLRASVPPEAARRLLVGGLPPSRLPVVLGALALAAGLLAAAVALARRERAVAAMRSDFVSAVSHELRTPLAQIRLFAETLMLERTRTPEERRRSLAIIDQEARRLSHLVDNTLQFTRAERGTIALDLAERDLSEIVREAIEAFSPIAAARGVRVAAQIPESLFARVDAGAVRQILVNLLDNAVKYGPPGQQVVVGLASGPRSVRLFVEDRGPGIPPGDRERIWEKFVRLERGDQAHAGGAGIGLSVVRDLASLHGATTRVEAADGGGARFVVEFPPGPAAPSLVRIPAEGEA